MKFSIKDFFSKSDQIRSFLQIGSHLLEKSLMKNFAFCALEEQFCSQKGQVRVCEISLKSVQNLPF